MNATHTRRSFGPARQLLAVVSLVAMAVLAASVVRTVGVGGLDAVAGVVLLFVGMGIAAALPFAVVQAVVAVLEHRPEP